MAFVVPYPHHAARYSNARGSSQAARERARAMRQGQPTAPSEVFAAARDDQESAADNAFRNAFLVGLRSVVEHLRTLMQGIREKRLQPPPEYSG